MPPWSNWARTVQAHPIRWERPTSDEQVADALRRAVRAGQRVKVVGSGHSWSAIARPDGVAMSIDAMDRVVELAEATVTVQAGIRLRDLVTWLAARGMALPILGSIAEQRLAGVLSTATHGSSLVHGNLSSLVTALRLITVAGDVLDLDAADPRFGAARVGLGALGVLTRVTLRVVPLFHLRLERSAMPFDQAAEQLVSIGRSAEYVKLWWLPHTAEVAVFRYHRTDAAPDASRLARWLDGAVINPVLFPALLAVGRWFPAVIPWVNPVVAGTYLKPATTVDRYDRQLTLEMPPRHRETEWAVPLDRGGDGLRGLRDVIAEQGVRVNFISEARFVPADDAWLSPAHARDVVQIGAYMARAPGIDAFFDGFAARMRALGGRPHWGKELAVDAAQVDAMWPRAADFRALARELDPAGTLRNPLLDALLR